MMVTIIYFFYVFSDLILVTKGTFTLIGGPSKKNIITFSILYVLGNVRILNMLLNDVLYILRRSQRFAQQDFYWDHGLNVDKCFTLREDMSQCSI